MRILALVVVAACSTQVSSHDQPIIGGTPATGEQATVLLVSYPPAKTGMGICTAVIASPTLLFTAAHCIEPARSEGMTFGVFLGDDAGIYPTLNELEPHLLPIAQAHIHPSFRTGTKPFGDLAVIELASPLAIAPVAIQRAEIDHTIEGTPVRIVGYGHVVVDDDNLARHEAMTVAQGIEVDTVIIGDTQRHTCFGDSGGPALVDGVLLGIASRGPVNCDGPAHYTRLDYHYKFVDQFLPGPPRPDAGITPDAPSTGSDGGCATGHTPGLALLLVAGIVRRVRRKSYSAPSANRT